MVEVGSRRRNLPAPPHVVFEALTEPNRDPARQWLLLRDDERRPQLVEAEKPSLVVWSSLWNARLDARICFELPLDSEGYGTDLCWVLLVEEPPPDPVTLALMCHRINELINGNLRYSFGA
jgi:hypothetical protein